MNSQSCQRLPEPDYVVMRTAHEEWKRHVKMVLSFSKPTLLIGMLPEDEPFLDDLCLAHHLRRVEKRSGIFLLWNEDIRPVPETRRS